MEAVPEEITFEKVWALIQKTNRQMKETDRRIGELGNRFGELVEYMVAPNIMEKFNALGFEFTKMYQNMEMIDPETRKLVTEADLFLENGVVVMVVEVKSKLLQNHVQEHIRRMEILRRSADMHNDSRKYRGALAGAIVSTAVRGHALNAGFYVIEQSGDTVKIEVPPGFTPREW